MNSSGLNRIVDFLVPFGVFLREVESEKPFSQWPRLLWQVIPFTFFVYWLFSFIPVVGTLIYIVVLVPLSARRHIQLRAISDRTEQQRIYLWYLTVVGIGFLSIRSFIGHTVLADSIAQQIGWATGSPFQTELAFYTLGSGVAGVLAIWLRGHMITALVISKSIFWYGAAYVHIYDAIVHHNYAPLNIGAPLVGDVILPTVFLILLFSVLRSGLDSLDFK